MRLPITSFACAAAAIVAVWWWLGLPVAMPPSPLGPDGKLYCVSYAPFRADQSPLDAETHIEKWQIEEDLARLKQITPCIRTYSTEHGLDQVPEVAQRHGLKVMLGVWLSSHPDKNRARVNEVVALAKQFPDVVTSVIVGNEVLLRGELSQSALMGYLREVKAAVQQPVTYADVWEFWLRNQELANVADFVTVHILPYWEDVPIPAEQAVNHVDSIRRVVAARFPGKEILIGEMGWPSAGRMRAGALPAPAEQALVLHQVLEAARRGRYRVNVIEAFDQPWKRRLEGAVGGYWGLYAAGAEKPKFMWGQPVSNHPHWRWYAAGGVAFAAAIFAIAAMASRRQDSPPARVWGFTAIIATVAGCCAGLILEKTVVESFGLGGWARGLTLAALAAAASLVGAALIAAGRHLPSFASTLGRRAVRPKDGLAFAAGAILIAITVMALQSALMLVFDPRYRDFPYAQLSVAVIPFALVAATRWREVMRAETTERAAAVVLALAAVFVALNEGVANWQAVWFAGVTLVLAVTLLRAPGGQS